MFSPLDVVGKAQAQHVRLEKNSWACFIRPVMQNTGVCVSKSFCNLADLMNIYLAVKTNSRCIICIY